MYGVPFRHIQLQIIQERINPGVFRLQKRNTDLLLFVGAGKRRQTSK